RPAHLHLDSVVNHLAAGAQTRPPHSPISAHRLACSARRLCGPLRSVPSRRGHQQLPALPHFRSSARLLGSPPLRSLALGTLTPGSPPAPRTPPFPLLGSPAPLAASAVPCARHSPGGVTSRSPHSPISAHRLACSARRLCGPLHSVHSRRGHQQLLQLEALEL